MNQSRFLHPLLLLSISLLFGCKPELAGSQQETPPSPSVLTCVAKTITLRPVLKIRGTLTSSPRSSALVCAQVSGAVVSVLVSEGELVKVQAELVRLDDRPARIEVARAKAQLKLQQARLTRARRGALPAEIEIARQQAKAANLTLAAKQRSLDAALPMERRGELSPVAGAALRSALAIAKTGAAASKATLQILEQGTRIEDIAAARAQVDAAEAELARATLSLKLCSIRSPIPGTVTRITAQPGLYASPGNQLVSLVDTGRLFAQVRLPSTSLPAIRQGSPAIVLIPGLIEPIKTTVARLGGAADPGSGGVLAYLPILHSPGRLRPNLSCQAIISLTEIPDALVVPVAAIADRGGVPVVTIIRDGKAYETEIVTGAQVHGQVQVTKGLMAGDTITVEGGYGLPHGCPVQAKPTAR